MVGVGGGGGGEIKALSAADAVLDRQRLMQKHRACEPGKL